MPLINNRLSQVLLSEKIMSSEYFTVNLLSEDAV
jgi:hypothetical protein